MAEPAADEEMPSALFERAAGDGDEELVVPTALTISPWSPHTLHGGPVAALLARSLEDLPTAGPMFPARFTMELLRPVTLVPLRIETNVVRPGKKVQVLEALLHADDKLVARATLQQIHVAAVELPAGTDTVNGPETGRPAAPENIPRRPTAIGNEGIRFHTDATEHRADGHFLMEPGPTQDWIRVVPDLFPDEPLSPFQRVAAVADFGNGVSSVLSFTKYAFVNPDLTIYLYRLPVDEWVCLDAITRIDTSEGAGSVGLAESALWDRQGRIGRSLQSLIIDPL